MAKTTEQKIKDRLTELYAQQGLIKRELRKLQEEPNNEETQRKIQSLEYQLESIENEIEETESDEQELKETKEEAKEYRWKDIEPLIKEVAIKYYMNYCVENNKFIYCMDMASKIKDELGEYVVVNPQFRMFEAMRAEKVISKLINKYLTDANHRIIKWFMTNNQTHFQATASFMTAKWSSDKVYNKASIISKFWVTPDIENAQSYHKDFDILLYCVGGGKQENIEHLEKWPVYKYWFPERVANTPNLDICGPLGANGKGRYLEMCKTIFTYGCVSPGTSKELSDGFNASWEMSTLIYFDEPTEKELAHNKVKNATGGEEQRIEKKGIDAYTADRNYSIMALSNNEKGVFHLEGTGMAGQDRRFSVVSTDIVMIDEIMRRENCTFEEATIRTNQIAQLIKDRKEVAKWMGYVMLKYDIPNMKILPPLHGQDYQQRFEEQKDKLESIFDKILPIFKENGCMPVPFLCQIVDSLLSTDKKKVNSHGKTISNKFKYYLQKNKVDFGLEQKQNIRVLFEGSVDDSIQFKQKAIFYYDKNVQINDFDIKTVSERPYSKEFGLSKDRLNFGID